MVAAVEKYWKAKIAYFLLPKTKETYALKKNFFSGFNNKMGIVLV